VWRLRRHTNPLPTFQQKRCQNSDRKRIKMKISYQETSNDLLKRINIHDQYGARDIDKWMLEVLPLKQGMRILDVGCGAGKQCFSYLSHLSGKADITGTDVSDELLAKAEEENAKLGNRVTFQKMDFNQVFPFPDRVLRPCLMLLCHLLR
jgi:cyclopropane fatty-acyl-phospholipid synthase-like methyltransferase